MAESDDKDIGMALTNKALKHIVRACEMHLSRCKRAEDLRGFIAFGKELLGCDVNIRASERMESLENNAVESFQYICSLARVCYKLMCMVDDDEMNKEIEEMLREKCFCTIKGVPCYMHRP